MSLSALANNMNVYAPSALTYAGVWDATTNYVKNNLVVGSDGSAYVLQIVSNTGTDPTSAPAPSPWVALAGGSSGGGGNLSLVPTDGTVNSGVWSSSSAYAVGSVVKDTTAGGAGGVYVCNTAITEPPAEGANVAPNVALGTGYSPWTLLAPGLTAGTGINLVPTAQGQTVAVSAPGSAGALKAILTGTALTPLATGGTPVGNSLTVPLQQFDLGLTAGHTYLLTVMFDGGANTTWTSSSSGASLTASPFIGNSATAGEDALQSLFGYGQLNTFSAPTSVSTVANGTNPVIDFPPLTSQVFYPALDANVYINCVLSSASPSVGGVAWTAFTNGWRIWACAVDCGTTPA